MTAPISAPDRDPSPRRVDSMLLLRDLVEGSLDEGYARAAARRTEHPAPRQRARILLAAGLVGVGLLLATAFEQARDRAGSAAAAQEALVAEVEQRVAANDRAERRLERRREAVARAQRRALALTGAGAELADRLAALEAVTGTGPVAGPGMVVTVDDAPDDDEGSDGDPRTGSVDEGRVTDRDLQTVVNEIWAAGAEAVAVNDVRLTSLGAIRAAGQAVLVDFRPLRPPYVIEAIGDPGTLRTSFVAGFGGSYLQVLQDYGISYSVEDADEVRLPASAGVSLRHAATPSTTGAAEDEGERTP